MQIITICGSLRFKEEIMRSALKLELARNIVITPIFPVNQDKDAFLDEELKTLSEMHMEKIKMADAIFVVNVDGYIGDSTKKEIDFAKALNKKIMYYSDLI